MRQEEWGRESRGVGRVGVLAVGVYYCRWFTGIVYCCLLLFIVYCHCLLLLFVVVVVYFICFFSLQRHGKGVITWPNKTVYVVSSHYLCDLIG